MPDFNLSNDKKKIVDSKSEFFMESIMQDSLMNYKKKDDINIKELVDSIGQYDKGQFLQRISALRTFFENRNKAFLLDGITTATINWLSKNNWNFDGLPMSYGRFKKIINKINQLESKVAIDPLDNPYVDYILFQGNYKVMPGMNAMSSYNLKMVIQTLFQTNHISISDEKRQYFTSILKDNLNISTSICNASKVLKDNYSINREIFIPSKEELDKAIGLVSIENVPHGVTDFLIKKDEVNIDKQTPFTQDNHLFLTTPYLFTNKGVILLDVTSISNALCFKFIEELGDLFTDNLIDEIWNDIRQSFNKLGHNSLDERKFSLELCNKKRYREELFNVSNNGILIGFGVFTNGNIHVDYSEQINIRIKTIINKLASFNVSNEKIFIVIVIHSLGGSVTILIENDPDYSKIPLSQFNAMEIKAISQVEKDDLFLPRYMRAKSNLLYPELLGGLSYGDFPYTIRFSDNDLSFYMTDDVDYKEVSIFMEVEETSDYYLKAQKNNFEKSFFSNFDKNWCVSLKEDSSNRYMAVDTTKRIFRCFIETKNKKTIEVITDEFTTHEELNVYFNCFDLISYWLENYYSNKDIPKNYVIFLCLKGKVDKYFSTEFIGNDDAINSISKQDSFIRGEITPQTYLQLGMNETNTYERKLIELFIQQIGNVDKELINKIFYPEYKKKINGVLVDDNGKLKVHTHDFQTIKISAYEINKLLDEIGIYLKSEGFKYGAISKENNAEFCKKVVDYLYDVLKKEIAMFDKEYLLNLLIAQMESILPEQLRGEESYNNNIALASEEKDKFFKQLNEYNQNSIATKFLLEYVAATSLNGKQIIDTWKLERLLAVCLMIIEWAHRSDYFKYKFIDTEIKFLKSNRIGLKEKDFQKVNSAVLNSRNIQLKRYDLPIYDKESYRKRIETLLENLLDNAFLEAFNYSYKEFDTIINCFLEICDDLSKTVWCIEVEELVNKIFVSLGGQIQAQKIQFVLESITLFERQDYLNPPSGFSNLDIYPWRFNRQLSFIRRPLIKYKNKYIYGIRNVIYARKYLLHLIFGGRLKTNSKKMKDLMSKLQNIKGDEFNEQVKSVLKEYKNLEVIKGVSKIGKQRITDDKKNLLGDIDVLAINEKSKKIFVIEAKDFSFARNPYEMAMEEKDVFSGKNPFLDRHLKRSMWISENLSDVIENYHLQEGDWKVITMFVVSESLLSKSLVNTKGVKFLEYKELKEDIFQ
ncbi:TPA: hypothetical protein ACF3RE_000495 [Enterococcus faecium]|uniref:hypothetical protein n=1 Tax=Enterococcus sp. E5-112 TaxID=3002977 RepID=UPI002D7FF4B0|nr:hypothetical protein [Enterococcus sp. E5-112]MEB4738166.1 hypothetical protein [Enterococcus sp. E5-112]